MEPGPQDRLFQEDIRSLGGAFALAKIELLAELVLLNAGSLLNYSSFARTIRASVESVQRWMELLKQLSFCFTLDHGRKTSLDLLPRNLRLLSLIGPAFPIPESATRTLSPAPS